MKLGVYATLAFRNPRLRPRRKVWSKEYVYLMEEDQIRECLTNWAYVNPWALVGCTY